MKATGLRKQKGIALVTALTILVGMTLIAFFANRSLIFEQKTSANQTRSTRAMEAAEAGLEWALANLNYQKKIDTACAALASPTGSDKTFRDRYLDPDGNGLYSETFSAVTPGCLSNGTSWTCSCPATGNPSFASCTAAGGCPTFTVSFQQVSGQPTMVQVISTGCTSPDQPCIPGSSSTADSTATVRQIFKIQAGLATPPAAPLTAKGNVSFGSNAITVTNSDPGTNGITINAGGTITGANDSTVKTLPGTPNGASLVGSDPSLSSLNDDQMFQTFFGQSKTDFQNASSTTQFSNCGANCTNAFESLVNSGANQIWVNGDLNINSNATIGSPTKPVIIVVNGNAHLNGGLVIYGVVYATDVTWDNTGGGGAKIIGAAIAEGNFTTTGTPDPTYSADVMNRLKETTGQFAKVLGSWRDF